MALKANVDSTTLSINGIPKDVLETAAKLVDAQIQLDGSYPELTDCLKMGGATLPTVSGLNDHDYPGTMELSLSIHNLAQLTTIKRVPLPAELVEQFHFMKSNCQMGLFPEIGRAWLTIDSNIFLWNFHDGTDLAYHDGLQETILCVGLVKPKPDVFLNYIHYLLCVATPVEIVILGVTFARQNENCSPFEEMHMLPEPLFTYPTDNVHMCTFEGTLDGRIFFGGKDGSIYEFAYQSQDRWFSRKCRKINHSSSALSFLVPSFLSFAFADEDAVLQIAVDNTRHILYTRREKGTIQVFDLGADGKSMSKVYDLHQQQMVQQVVDILKTIDVKNFYPVVHISPVEATESKFVHLVAVTQSGVRLYFTTNGGFGDSRPFTLALLHVRLPPGFTANASVSRPMNVHKAYYKKGFIIMTASQTEDNDVIFSMSNDCFPLCSQLIETHTTMLLDGHSWALAEVPNVMPLPQQTVIENTAEITCDPPAIVTQHRDFQRQFVLISPQGIFILRQPRPVDQLVRLLLESKGPDNEAIRSFFVLHKEAQACAMCLILACSPDFQDIQVSDWAVRAFFMYGGEPHLAMLQMGDAPMSQLEIAGRPSTASLPPVWSSTPQTQQRATGALSQPQFSGLFSPVRSPSIHSPMTPAGTPAATPAGSVLNQPAASETSSGLPTSDIVFSGRHNALYLFFARIVRPIWNKKMVLEKKLSSAVAEDPNLYALMVSNITTEELSFYLLQLSALRRFLQNNSQSFHTSVLQSNLAANTSMSRLMTRNGHSTIDSTPTNFQRRNQSEAEMQERASLSNFHQLVNYTHEMLSLWKILCDHQFPTVVSFLLQVQQDTLKQFTLKDFITDGKELSVCLTNALINFYLEDNARTSTISEKLRELCPTIYKVEDATVSRAQEIVLNARNIVNKAEKDDALEEALKLCRSIAPKVDLELMCKLFRNVSYHKGIVALCLCCAQRGDAQDLALHFYRSGEPPDDLQGKQAFINRMQCYSHIVECINELKSQSHSHPLSHTVPKVPGPPPHRDPGVLIPEEAKDCSEEMLEMALKSDDELFHVALYDWLIERNETDILLCIKSHFLEDYLKRCSVLRPDNLYILNLLWKYYEKNQSFSAAARILAKLADKHGVEMNLSQRIEYLSRAIMCVKGSEMRISSSGEGEFLHELEEKMEVARIQMQIVEALKQRRIVLQKQAAAVQSIDAAINTLNINFLGIQELYEEYAVQFKLAESQLAILQCGGIFDITLVESLWHDVIENMLISTFGVLPDNRAKILQEKLISISQPYVNSEKYFPIMFIVKFLEAKTCSLNLEPSWVFRTMLLLNVGVVELLKIYHRLHLSADSCWAAAGRPLHPLVVLAALVRHFADAPSAVPANERRSFCTFCLDVISGYLVDLQGMSSSTPQVPELIQEFKLVQHKLERLT